MQRICLNDVDKLLKGEPIYLWNDMAIVFILDKPEFCKWLYGQTLPYIEDDENPTGWAYLGDYVRFLRKQKVVD